MKMAFVNCGQGRNCKAKMLLVLLSFVSGFILALLVSRKMFQLSIKEDTTFKGHCEISNSSNDWDILLNSENLTGSQIVQYFMWNNRNACQLVQDFGGTLYKNPSGWDGQKSVCLDPQIAPQPGGCIVYSFGIKNQWSFDEQMSQYGCQVFAFDPSMGKDPHDHMPGNIHFYNWGLGNQDKHDVDYNWAIRSLSSIYEELSARHGRKIIDYLKIDIEFDEWVALPDMMASGMLSKVRQLSMEVHMDYEASLEQHRDWAKLLRSMENMGMVRFDSEYNPWYVGTFNQFPLTGSLGYEIAWYNSNYSSVSA
ncbi:hypothetical protein GHT06_010081 [Daphnia sinensis]|uniref:Methyltransferase domain-containing protein n=1 Tax=Daphnia sinensis TaxID=1820382 RepID=A0AAD5L0F2_9CRUS|nr:hypothetical protein GHT06_010081 [Daphnia sinensis]